MAQISKSYGGKWLKADDIPMPRGIRTTIDEVTEEELGRGADKQTKLVAWLKGQDKGLVLNKTNATALAELYGDESDDWAGKPIALTVGKAMFEGKKVDSIMVDEEATRAASQRSAPAQPRRKPASVVTQAEADAPDEELPW
jgi:hypothetical protein